MSYYAPIPSPAAAAQSLGRWLLSQARRDDAIGQLAAAAARDSQFPRDGDYKAISGRLNAIGADPEMHEALDQADLDWSAY